MHLEQPSDLGETELRPTNVKLPPKQRRHVVYLDGLEEAVWAIKKRKLIPEQVKAVTTAK